MTDPLLHRPRRLRLKASLRRLLAATYIHAGNLVQPLFVSEHVDEPRPIDGMPGMALHTRETLRKAAAVAADAGAGGLMIFGVPDPSRKNRHGSQAWAADGITQHTLADVTAEVGQALVVIADVNLDGFTDHGHAGIRGGDGDVDNDATLQAYARVAVAQAQAGAHMVAPSGMMDGQAAAIPRALDEAGHTSTPILAYSATYASAFYGPFHEAVSSPLAGDRATHQQDPAGPVDEALREVRLHLAQSAAAVIVKPALPYLDNISAVRAEADVPVGAYQASGEYAMVEAATAHGWIDRERAIRECLLAIRRAGAGFVITSGATEVARRAAA